MRRALYRAAGPLVLRHGVRALAMRDVARAAHHSVGGIYHYFPSKRELVLYGLDAGARDRLCRELRAGIDALPREAALDAYLDRSLELLEFVRPAVVAAMELGFGELQARLDAGFAQNLGELEETLRLVAPDLPDREVRRLGEAIRRLALGFVVDRAAADAGELRAHLSALIRGAVALSSADGPGASLPIEAA